MKNLIATGLLMIAIFFWQITLLVLFFLFIVLGWLLIIMVKYIKKYSNIEDMKKNKPWYMPKFVHSFIIKYITDKMDDSKHTLIQNKLLDALEFYGFESVNDLTKIKIKMRWKDYQKIFHPDVGLEANEEKSKLANEYKEVLLIAVQRLKNESDKS